MELQELYNEWFGNPDWWFAGDPEVDMIITNKYGHLLETAHTALMHVDALTMPVVIALVLLYDQVSRHVFRKVSIINKHKIIYFTGMAIEISQYIIIKYLERLTIQELCFVLMPFRHSQQYPMTLYAIEVMWRMMKQKLDSVSRELAKRWLKAAYERCQIEDQSHLTRLYPNNGGSLFVIPNLEEFANILDFIPDEIVHNLEDLKNEPCYEMVKKALPHGKKIIISLSGGVDSMICSYMISSLLGRSDDVKAVHINYANRDCSDKEELFVRSWCAYLGMPLYVRKISEINRRDCMEMGLREVYETYTRNVRMATYKCVCSDAIVVLGHNKNDCFENILTNMTHQNKYENLQGMMVLDDKFYRPLLGATKADIKNFAYKYGIPHLGNSTPSWSARGKIRDLVRPALERWDDRTIDGFFAMADAMKDMHSIMDAYITGLIDEGQKHIRVAVDTLPKNETFWMALLKKMACAERVSNKSVKSLMERLRKRRKGDSCNVVLNKNMRIIISDSEIHLKTY
jgi:tRNA(Ile)-lysidine synthetase-like protein